MSIVISCIIPVSAKDAESQNLKDLIASIKAQDFPQDKIEILVITEGDSEQAKAIGIKQAKGEICAMFCADNCIVAKNLFSAVAGLFGVNKMASGLYARHYYNVLEDNSLNRYFSLIGGNDPISFYLGKNDRLPAYLQDENMYFEYQVFRNRIPSLGDNGFFYWREKILKADLDHYYPMDCAVDLIKQGENRFIRLNFPSIWHRTSDNLISFLKKRYRYAKDLYCDRQDRRWKMLDTREDYIRLAIFILCTVTVIPCLMVSFKGFAKIKDPAWFWHWPVCAGFLITYSILALRNWIKYGQFFQCPQPSVS